MKDLRVALAVLIFGAILATALSEAWVDMSENPADKAFEQGNDAFAMGDYLGALKAFTEARKGTPNKYPKELILTWQGNAYEKLGQYDKALACHDAALQVNPDFASAWTYKGVSHRYRNELDQAEACYSRAMELDPNSDELLTSFGVLLLARGKPSEAIPLMEKAIKIDPKFSTSRSNLAIAYAMVGRIKDAREQLESARQNGYPDIEKVEAYIKRFEDKSNASRVE